MARIGICGYCPPTKYDQDQASAYLKNAFDGVETDFLNQKIIAVSGVTNVGVLAQAYQLATKRGYQTCGVGCENAYEFEWFPTTEKPIIVGKNWGDESPVFINGIIAIREVDPEKVVQYLNHPHYGLDAMVRIGIGAQSIRETNMIREMGKPTYEYDLPRLE